MCTAHSLKLNKVAHQNMSLMTFIATVDLAVPLLTSDHAVILSVWIMKLAFDQYCAHRSMAMAMAIISLTLMYMPADSGISQVQLMNAQSLTSPYPLL